MSRRTPYWDQGDVSLYATETLESRWALRRESTVADALEEWWEAARRSLLAGRAAHPTPVPPTTEVTRLTVSRDQYVQVYAAVYAVLIGGTGFYARACGEAEWWHDCHGHVVMTRELWLDIVPGEVTPTNRSAVTTRGGSYCLSPLVLNQPLVSQASTSEGMLVARRCSR